MECQSCGKSANDAHIKHLLQCSACKCAYYCSIECQKLDWFDHNKFVCSLWKGTGNVVNNPWYSNSSPSSPNILKVNYDEDLFNAAKKGDVESLAKCIEKNTLLSTTKGPQGETVLHFAVTSGDVESVKLFVESGAYINSTDWRGNTPMYYACTHPGENNILKDNIQKRSAIVSYLLKSGGDTMKQGGLSNKRPFEVAREYGFIEIADLIESSPLHKTFKQVRELLNTKHPAKHFESLVKKFLDIEWRFQTLNWFIQINRQNLMQCMNPHPQLLKQFKNNYNIEWVERMFKDCQARHQRWWDKIKSLENIETHQTK